MEPQEVKKRKSCNACTKAKAKCYPFVPGADICHRCERLSKECIYADSLRKRGPRTRSRMKQLEQRVETLMGLLSGSGASTSLQRHESPQPSGIREPDMTSASKQYVTPEDSASQSSVAEFATWDPVEQGILDVHEACTLLGEFREDFAESFPFVVIDESISADVLRQEKPFLFLAVMTAMAYRLPSTQSKLAQCFRDQIAARIAGCTHKDLEVLQGLLVHTAYYHFVYQPGKQQLALVTQMCVAISQDLGPVKTGKTHGDTTSSASSQAAEARAHLGAYYTAAVFAQAWRKRTTLSYTHGIRRASQAFSQQPEYPSDLLIAPLIQLTELGCRISDHFSYDSIEDSDISGELNLELTTSNFCAELRRLRDSFAPSIRENTTVRLAGDHVEVTIYECSVHGIFWQPSPFVTHMVITHTRARMLEHSLVASRTYARTLLEVPAQSLHRLTVSVWAGWFYSTLLVVKAALLRQTGNAGSTNVNLVPHTVGDFLPKQNGGSATSDICSMTASLAQAHLTPGHITTQEAEFVSIFFSFIEKLRSSAPQTTIGSAEECASPTKPFLSKVATLQSGMLSVLKKMTKERDAAQPLSDNLPGFGDSQTTTTYNTFRDNQPLNMDFQPHIAPMSEHLSPAYFDGLGDFGAQSTQDTPSGDWLWDMVMNDDTNMFNF